MRISDWSSDVCSSDLYGEGFKAPTLYQLFSEYGNVALRPEQAHGWEVGAEQRFLGGRLNLGATYFERTTTDQIIYDSCAPTSADPLCFQPGARSEEHTSELQSLMRTSYAVISLEKKKTHIT